MWSKIKYYVYFIALTLATSAAAGFITKSAMPAYESVRKSRLNPPSIVFPIVWTVLYILMGISAAAVYKSSSNYRKPALSIFFFQLAVNFLWSIIFFNLQAYFFAFVWLILLLILIAAMIFWFCKINIKAGLLQIPYLLWVSFAGYLNYAIYIMNT